MEFNGNVQVGIHPQTEICDKYMKNSFRHLKIEIIPKVDPELRRDIGRLIYELDQIDAGIIR